MTAGGRQGDLLTAPLTTDGLFQSRYFRTDDPTVDVIRVSTGLLRRRTRTWNLSKMRWWSRHYEYRWLTDCLDAWFQGRRASASVLDAACGDDHPGCLMLAKMGFAQVDALDMHQSHPLIDLFDLANLNYIRGDLTCPPGRTYDAVCCISLLEHLDRPAQKTVMENLCDAVAPGGCLVVTFVTPGFEYDTDLALYRTVLADRGVEVNYVEVSDSVQLTSRNSRTPYPGWPDLGRDVTSVYRLFGVRT